MNKKCEKWFRKKWIYDNNPNEKKTLLLSCNIYIRNSVIGLASEDYATRSKSGLIYSYLLSFTLHESNKKIGGKSWTDNMKIGLDQFVIVEDLPCFA